MLEMKNTITKINNASFTSFNSFQEGKKKINVLESKSIESTQSETHRKRKKQEKAN